MEQTALHNMSLDYAVSLLAEHLDESPDYIIEAWLKVVDHLPTHLAREDSDLDMIEAIQSEDFFLRA
jgi:hypothetical protein